VLEPVDRFVVRNILKDLNRLFLRHLRLPTELQNSRVNDGLLASNSKIAILGEHLSNEILGLFGNVNPALIWQLKRIICDRFEDLQVLLAQEGRRT
jgi:hypothetical protein